jgi:hypothetical protein
MDCSVYGEVTKLEKTSLRSVSVAVTISADEPKQEIQVILPFTGLPEGLTIGTHVVLHLALVVK